MRAAAGTTSAMHSEERTSDINVWLLGDGLATALDSHLLRRPRLGALIAVAIVHATAARAGIAAP